MIPTMPNALYRLQFNAAFTFNDAAAIMPYLGSLGISHIYASPILCSRPESSHGYDVTDSTMIDPKLGTKEEFASCVETAAGLGIGWIQDIVPNHMAFCKENTWLMDVLENGMASKYAAYFDIEWGHVYDSLKGRVLAPFLGDFYGACLDRGEIRLGFDRFGFFAGYYNHRFPLRIESYAEVLSSQVKKLREDVDARNSELVRFFGILYTFKNLPAPPAAEERYEQIGFAKEILWELYTQSTLIHQYIDAVLAIFNGGDGIVKNFDLLDELLSKQHFRLSFWKVATEELDYRRFFTVNDLISLRIDNEVVFEHSHALVFDFINRGIIQGLRVDHIDGLHDPLLYLERLRLKAPKAYIVVEKILGKNETLRTWPVQGTTGYEALNVINGFFCDTQSKRRFDRIYGSFTEKKIGFERLSVETKRIIVGKHMAGDIDNLAHQFKRISSRDRSGSDITLYGLRRALVELMTFFPVYRTYIDKNSLSSDDTAIIEKSINDALLHNPAMQYELEYIKKFMLLRFNESTPPEVKADWIAFVMRFQQFTGPLMAKGIEDTAMYVYNRFVSHNEVGGDPSVFGVTLREFHAFFSKQARLWPHSMLTLSTHDTKRGEDVRARLNVLSEMPIKWLEAIKRWRTINKVFKSNDGQSPDANDEYLFYQTAVGTFPFFSVDEAPWRERIAEYMIKAVREAKVHTAWLKPDTRYEDSVVAFVKSALDASAETSFLTELRAFAETVSWFGMLNSLSQTLVKLTAPGVPDIYQGSELWDLWLVDPDNRRPVDFENRRKILDAIIQTENAIDPVFLQNILHSWKDGGIKLFLIQSVLKSRTLNPNLFSEGAYYPVRSQGMHGRNCAAFRRFTKHGEVLVVFPRFYSKLSPVGTWPLGPGIWRDTYLEIPKGPKVWHDELTNGVVEAGNGKLYLGEALNQFPIALFRSL